MVLVAPGRHVHTIGELDYVRFDGHEIDRAKARAAEYLEQVAAKMGTTKATVRHELEVGDSAEAIIRLAGEMGTCLVAMSTYGYSGIERWVFGSVTHRVLHHGNTPLLLVRAPGANR